MSIISIKLPITEISNHSFVLNKQNNWSYAFRKLYTNSHLINDKQFLDNFKIKYKLDAYELNCLLIDVKTKISQVFTSKSNIENQIIETENKLKLDNIKPNLKHKLGLKLNRLNKQLSKEIMFGNLINLKKISYLSNDKEINLIELERYKKLYQDSRILPISYYGSKHDKNSNRYFNFNFKDDEIIYKFNKNNINIKYKCSKNYQKILNKLDLIKNDKLLPITVKLSKDFVIISYDAEVLNGYAFNSIEYKKEVKEHITVEAKKEVAVKYYKEQKDRKLKNKLPNRYMAIDLNPEYVGLSILDKNGIDQEFKIMYTICYDTTKLNVKLGLKSEDAKQICQNNKRKYEIGCLWKSIFKLAKHYKASHIVLEDLNFKPKVVNTDSKEFNRKCKNIWNLNYQQNLINKHIDENGLIKIEVNPCYTSFIGNIKYKYFDAVNASIEIGRRGMYKYNKGFKMIPIVTEDNLNTMELLFKNNGLDVSELDDCLNWNNYYFKFKQTKCKYRFGLKDVKTFKTFSMNNNIKSKVLIHTFD